MEGQYQRVDRLAAVKTREGWSENFMEWRELVVKSSMAPRRLAKAIGR